MRHTHITHVTPSISRLAGGLFESVRHLSLSVHQQSHAPVEVLALEDEDSHEDVCYWNPMVVHTHPVMGPPGFGYSPSLAHDLHHSGSTLVHLHGVWRYLTIAVWRWAKQSGHPYLVSPHGMLEPWALRQSQFKKRLAMWLYQGPCLRGAACIRATSTMEVESIHLAGFKNPIALVPNGVPLPTEPLSDRPQQSARRRALFLSRIHPKKGLLNLVEAWRQARPANWELVIVGPDEGGHLVEVKQAVQNAGLQDSVSFQGEIWNGGKTQVYLSSDLFVLPTFSENFGLVIAEALACGVPVITTRGTPWEELEQHRCGWWIDIGVDPLVRALKEAVALPPDALHDMGLRGRKLIEAKYTWGPIGQKMIEVYQWMLGRAERPDCIV